MANFFKKVTNFLEWLSSKPKVGGLELSDSAVRFVLFREKGEEPDSFALRLPPGVMRDGKLEDPGQFSQILKNLHEQILPGENNKIIQAVVSLPSAQVYTQSFNVPNVGPEKLSEAALLNLQTISPLSAEKAYMSCQLVKEMPDRYEFLGAVVEKGIIDQLRTLMEAAKFQALIFEFPALALGRLLEQALSDRKSQSVLLFWISSEGLNLFVFKNGALYFDYFRSWRSIQGDNREIQRSVFESVVVEEIQKVVHFTNSRFKESLKDILIIAPGFEPEMKIIIESRFGLTATAFRTGAYSLGSSWYVALGSAIRGGLERSGDKFINLGSESVAAIFYERQILNFVRLWRSILIGVLFLFLLVFVGSAVYFVKQEKFFSERLVSMKNPAEQNEFKELGEKAKEFNDLVASIAKIKERSGFEYQFLSNLQELAKKGGITLDGLGITSVDEPINLLAHAPDSDAVLKFKNILVGQRNFFNVDLPISKISTLADGSVSFSMSFQVKR